MDILHRNSKVLKFDFFLYFYKLHIPIMAESIEAELEKSFKAISLINSNDVDIYFRILDVLSDDKKEQQRFMAMIDAACLDYLNKNSSIVQKLEETKFDKGSINTLLNVPAIKEFNMLINELKAIIKDIKKTYGIYGAEIFFNNFSEFVHSRIKTADDHFHKFAESLRSLLVKIGKLLYNNNLINITSVNTPYIYVQDGFLDMVYPYEAYVKLSDDVRPKNNHIKLGKLSDI